MRRKQFHVKATVHHIEEKAHIIEDFHFHVHSGRVYIGNTALALSTKEFQIFFFLAQRPGQIFPHQSCISLFGQRKVSGIHRH